MGTYWIKHKIIYSYITSHFSHFLSTAGLESAQVLGSRSVEMVQYTGFQRASQRSLDNIGES